MLNKIYCLMVACGVVAVSCEIDNYDGPDATVAGVLYDHTGQPLQVNHGAGYIRAREISWEGAETGFISNQTLKIQMDGTYRHTKWFSGDYMMLPYGGNFFPYDEEKLDADDAGELVKIPSGGNVTQDFTVTPWLTLEWVKKPSITADGYLECSVRFKRNQKGSFRMPDLNESYMRVGRSVNAAGSADGTLFPDRMVMTNDMEDKEIAYRTKIQLKYGDIDYYVRVQINCKAVAGDASTNYPGVQESCWTTTEKIHAPTKTW